MADHQRLRELAQKATPGPWELDALENREHGLFINDDHPEAGTLGCASNQVAGFMVERNAEFIAAADPATILALLDELANAYARGARETYEWILARQHGEQWDEPKNPYREEA
jgi:hypothetical protein